MVSCLIPTTKLHGNNCKHKSGPYPDQNPRGCSTFYKHIFDYFLQQQNLFLFLNLRGATVISAWEILLLGVVIPIRSNQVRFTDNTCVFFLLFSLLLTSYLTHFVFGINSLREIL